jgi:hypothetical protein
MRFSQALRRKIALTSGRYVTATDAVWSHPEFRTLYPNLLSVVHAVARASVPLMEAARDALQAHPDDSVTSALDAYLHRHIPEETGHDQWVLDDLAVLGHTETLGMNSWSSVATLIGAQYYWLRHLHPLTLLGYIAVIEGQPVDAAFVQEVGQRHGLPEQSLRAFVRHGRIDIAHSADLDRVLDGLTLTRRQEGWIALSAFHTIAWLTTILQELLERHRDNLAI